MRTRRWLPVALCCLPGVAVVALLGVTLAGGAAFSGALSGPLGVGLIALAALACPLSMGLMMWRQGKKGGFDKPTMDSECCRPGEENRTTDTEHMAALRTRREVLEREIANLQS